MNRPKPTTAIAMGVMVSTKTNVGAGNGRVPKTDPKFTGGEAPDAYGLMLSKWLGYAPAANDVFTPAELAARIETHAQRVEREMAEWKASLRRRPKKAGGRPRKRVRTLELLMDRSSLLPDGREYADLKVVNCCGCRKLLLSACEEHVRRGAAKLPPPVGGRSRDGRALCRSCHNHNKGGR